MTKRFLHPVIRVLVFCPPPQLERLGAQLGLLETLRTHKKDEPIKLSRTVRQRALRFHLIFAHTVEEARQALTREYFNVLVVDCSDLQNGSPDKGRIFALHRAMRTAPSLHSFLPWRWERTLALLPDDPKAIASAFEVGRLGIGGYELLPTTAAVFFEAVTGVVEQRAEVGKTAICLAGGGIEGLIYEMGVLSALDTALEGRSILDFDIFCGISAGAILSCTLANGVPPEEFIKAFEKDSSAIAPIDQGVIFDFDYREYLSRVAHMVSGVGRLKKGLAGLMALSLRSIPVGFFAGDRIYQHVVSELKRAGRTADFRKLKKELYIGATDQDTAEHIVFGDRGWDDVPIPDAVRASMALVPFYSPKWIRGRWFVDGSYTRTSELDVAVQKGAKLVIIIDPLVPVRSTVSGYVKAKGGVFGGIQGLKSLVHTRFSEGMLRALELYPDVDFYIFKPEQDDMRLMSGSPLKYNFRMEIQRLAYLRTLERIQEDLVRMESEWSRHGFHFNPKRIKSVLSAHDDMHGPGL
jgi:predicted acylesterase/phospholipase RssA